MASPAPKYSDVADSLPVAEPKARIRELDGLRALAVMLVVVSHAIAVNPKAAYAPIWRQSHILFLHGLVGVQIFFVISGFIITRLLIREDKHDGKIQLRNFYLRRVAKLFPPVFALVAVTAVFEALLSPGASSKTCYAAALTFTTQLWGECSWNLGHLWSLNVEEFFYLAWPLALVKMDFRKARVSWLVGVAALCVVFRIVEHSVLKDGVARNFLLILQFMDHLTMGAALAIFMERTSQQSKLRLILSHPAVVWSALLSVMGLRYLNFYHPNAIMTFSSPTFYSFAFALLILNVLDRVSWVSRFFGSRPVAFVGLCSYSIYLFQELVFSPSWTKPYINGSTSVALAFIVGATLVGLLAYQLIEKPAQALVRRYLQRFMR